MNPCAVCESPTLRAVHDTYEPARLIPYCTTCLEKRPMPRPKSAAITPLAPETINEATLASDTARRTLDSLKVMPVTAQNMELVGRILIGIKTQLKDLKARQDAITAPMRAAEKSVRDLFRPALNSLAEAESILKRGIADAQAAQLAANRQVTVQAQEALARGSALGAAQAATQLTHIAPPTGITTREVWTFRVVQPELVPRELCVPDDTKIRAAVAMGYRDIPGVVVELDTQVSVRTG